MDTHEAAETLKPAMKADYNVAVGYLRAFARLLVFALHSFVAYYAGPHPITGAVLRMSIPIDDPKHFAGARILVAFNEISLMSLLFFLSGLFLWPSLSKRGPSRFLRERLVRLGLPFLVCGGLVAAIAYYPAYLVSTPHPSLGGYASTWLTPGRWTTGPGWFLLVLFIYDLVAMAVHAAAPGWGHRLARVAADAQARPLRFFALVLLLSAAAYVPLALALGAYDWWHLSIFWLQKSRALHYAVYFFLGTAAGAYGLNRGLMAPGGNLAKYWMWWGLASIAAFLIVANVLKWTIDKNLEQDLLYGTLADVGFVICCAVCSFALIAIFVRFARRNRILDAFADNSYGMYIVHYMFVTWTQFALLKSSMSAPLKAICVFAVTLVGSWLLAAALRRYPPIGRIV